MWLKILPKVTPAYPCHASVKINFTKVLTMVKTQKGIAGLGLTKPF